MATTPLTLSLHRDIRSSSVPRQRFASKRAKYGGAPPDDVGFPYSQAFPGLTFDSKTGRFYQPYHPAPPRKPTTLLTKRQKYDTARQHVPTLVGKHVNRNNQRTGERDPWRYYGPTRKWARKEQSGALEADRIGESDHQFLLSGVDADIYDAYLLGQLPEDGWWEPEVEAEEMWGQKYGDGEGLTIVDDRGRRRRRQSVGGWTVVRLEDAVDRWTEGGEEDDWEVVSTSSTAG